MSRARDLADGTFSGAFSADSPTFVVDAANNLVGVGTASPSSLLDVDKSQDAETNIEITNTNAGSAAQVRTKYTTNGGLFTVGKTSDAHVFGGDAYLYNVDNTNIRFATNDTERLRILSTGGITFNGDTAAANALDDYEEGTFTPTAYGDATAGTTTYVAQQGLYTKVGRQVSIVFFVGWSAMTGTGSVRIGGLPFTAANLSQNYAPFTTLPSDINWSGGTAYVALQMQNTDYMYLYGQNDDGGSSPQAVVNEYGTIRISGTYIAA